MIEEISRSNPLKSIEEIHGGTNSEKFEAKVRYLASSLIVTIPVNVARELGIKLGDKVLIQVRKKEASPAVPPEA